MADRHGVKETKAFARTLAMRGIARAGGLEPDLRIRKRLPACIENLTTHHARRTFQAKGVFARNSSQALARPGRESRSPTLNEHPYIQSTGSRRIGDITVTRCVGHQIPAVFCPN